MGNWSLGSVSTEVLTLIESVPSAISGTPIERIADRQRQFVEEYTGTAIGSNAIGIKHQGPILHLTMAEVLKLMNVFGVDAESVTLGDFTVRKGGGQTNLDVSAAHFQELGMEELKKLGVKVQHYRTY